MGARIEGAWPVGTGIAPGVRVSGSSAQSYAAGGVEVVMDGVIYNRPELGHEPDDASLLHQLYRRHGFRSAIERLNGDFTVALLDRRRETLWLARDRFGLQPLYYARNGGIVAFASQPGPLLAIPWVSTTPDPRFLALFAGSHYRTFDNDPHRSPYQDVFQLPGAHLLRADGAGVRLERYWSLEESEDLIADEGELADEYRALLEDAVGIRLRSARLPAFTLSGGMDSSTVVATAARLTQSPQAAFSTVYADTTFDESDDIAPMLDGPVGTWSSVLVDKPDVFDLVDRLVALHDEPVATATWLSHYLLAGEVARAGHDMLFGGLGGDELNAGEYEYFVFHFADLRLAGDEGMLADEIAAWVRHHDHPLFRKSLAVAEQQLRNLVDIDRPGRCLPDRKRMLRYAEALTPDARELITAFRPEMDAPFSSYLRNRTYQDMTRETAPCCLRAEDRHMAALGLRRSDPFFDHRLAEFMFRIPGTMKIRDGITKRLLREAMRGVLPEETRQRVKKTGWNAPAHVWFTGEGADHIRDLLHSRGFSDRGLYQVPEVERLLQEHEALVASGTTGDNHMMFFWQLVNLESWLRHLVA